MSQHDHDGHHDDGHHGPGYVKVYVILLVLFLISVAGPEIRDSKAIEMSETVGNWMVLITAFGIALVKAYYVIAYFMHLKFEKKIITYMLTTTLVFMFLFFAAVAPDVMKHEGSNWVNAAAAGEVERALEAQKNPPKQPTNELQDPESITTYARTGEARYQVPIEVAMKAVVNDGARAVNIVLPRDPNAATPEMLAEASKKALELAAAPREAFKVDPAKAKQGEALFASKICASCHSVDGSKLVGPTFKGLIGRVIVTEKAEVLVADSAYFAESIKAPQAKVGASFVEIGEDGTATVQDYSKLYAKGSVMPVLQVSDAEADALLHYAATLQAPPVAAAPTPAPGAEGAAAAEGGDAAAEKSAGDTPKKAPEGGAAAPK